MKKRCGHGSELGGYVFNVIIINDGLTSLLGLKVFEYSASHIIGEKNLPFVNGRNLITTLWPPFCSVLCQPVLIKRYENPNNLIIHSFVVSTFYIYIKR
jgi:hypothetical protein